MSVKSAISSFFFKSVERKVLHSMKRVALKLKTVKLGGNCIEYWDNESEKPPLLLIHGFGATTKFQFTYQVKELSEKYRLILPNLLHFGKSKPDDASYSVADQVQMVHDLLENLNCAKYIVCGVSYGGLVAIELANLYKNEVEKLIIFDTPVKFMKREDIEDVCQFFNVKSVVDLFVPNDERGIKNLIWLAMGKKTWIPSFMFKAYFEKLYSFNLADKRKVMEALLNDLDKYAARDYIIDIPILLIWGENDKIVPKARGRMLANHLGENTEFELISGAAHMPNITHHKKFNALVIAFLS